MKAPHGGHLSILALCALGFVLAGCGSADKGIADSPAARFVRAVWKPHSVASILSKSTSITWSWPKRRATLASAASYAMIVLVRIRHRTAGSPR